jgi:hypothetical protein
MEQDAFTEEQWECFGDSFTDMDNDCVIDDAAQHTRAVAAVVTAAAGSCDAQKVVGGSSVGRRRNVDRGFDEGFARLNSDYFGVNPTYDAATFARRFRMPQSVFNRIYTALSGRPEFLRKAHALGVFGLYPLQRIVAAIRILGYVTAADACDEYVRISESSAADALLSFVKPYARSLEDSTAGSPTRRISAVFSQSTLCGASPDVWGRSTISTGNGSDAQFLLGSLPEKRRSRRWFWRVLRTGSCGSGMLSLETLVA